MSSSSAQFVGSIPEHYDRGLGPVIFADYAVDLARRVAATRPSRVLEVAAGTGIATRALRDVLPGDADLMVSDLNPPMLEVARGKFGAGEKVNFQPADATKLPFADGVFDAVACQFGVMFFPDKDAAYREVYRVLAPGGWYTFNVWDGFEYNPFGQIAQETITRYFQNDPPRFYRVPFGYAAIDPIKSSLLAAGFDEISASVVRIQKTVPSAEAFAKGLVLGNPVIEEIRNRSNAPPEQIIGEVTTALLQAFGPDPGRMPLQAIVFSARRPG